MIMVIAGLTNSVTNLLVPIQLRANGVSINAISVLLAAAAVLYILASVSVSRLGARAATVRAAGFATLAMGASLALPVSGNATVPLAAFVLVRSALHATMTTIAYPIAAAAGEAAGVGAATALGFTNAGWATASVVGPLVGGAIAQSAGNRAAFAALVPLALVAAGWLLLGGRAPTIGRPRPARTGGRRGLRSTTRRDVDPARVAVSCTARRRSLAGGGGGSEREQVTVVLTGHQLTLAEMVRVARHAERVEIDTAALAAMAQMRAVVEHALARGDEVYGLTTASAPPRASASTRRRCASSTG